MNLNTQSGCMIFYVIVIITKVYTLKEIQKATVNKLETHLLFTASDSIVNLFQNAHDTICDAILADSVCLRILIFDF